MGIYIKGMEMPKSCILCDLSHEDGWCPAKQDYIDRYSFETCPLVPIPPHGRLIDADGLMREMPNVILEDGEDRRTFYSVIERQPTVIPADKEE